MTVLTSLKEVGHDIIFLVMKSFLYLTLNILLTENATKSWLLSSVPVSCSDCTYVKVSYLFLAISPYNTILLFNLSLTVFW